MKRTLIAAAVGAMGAMGAAGLISAGTASADTDCTTKSIGEGRVACLTAEQFAEFKRTTSLKYNLDTLFNGSNDGPNGENNGLGLNQQLQTFQDSISGYLSSGPVNPDPAPPSGNGY